MAEGQQPTAAPLRKKRRNVHQAMRAARWFRPRLEALEDRRLLAVGAVSELRLTATDAAAADLLGESVAIDGDYMVVGSPGNDDGSDGAGAAYVYRFDGSTWLEQERLLADDPGEADGFGGSVAISGETIVVGAAGHDEAALVDAGAAYVFVFDGGSWSLQEKLLPDDGAAGDAFGSSVTIEGDVVAVGAAGASAASPDVGAAYVFGRTDDTWSQQDKLLADDSAPGDAELGDEFGAAIDLSDDRIVVGAPGGDAAGAAYVFQRNESDWAFLSKLPASGAAFGDAVAVSGTTAVVGAAANNAGSAFVFVEQAGNWNLQAALSAPDASGGDLFGSAVDIRTGGVDDLVLVGAAHNIGLNGGGEVVVGAGAAYLFGRDGSDWNLRAKLTADDPGTDDGFGSALALDAERLVVGSSLSDGDGGADAGAAYAYSLNRFDAPAFLPHERVDDIQSNDLNEASGMVASRQSPGVLWAHNDSGGQRRLFAMNSGGEHLGIFGMNISRHRDWEDIETGPGPVPGVQYLYVGDFGNNSAQTGNPHPNIRIYRVAEPVVDPNVVVPQSDDPVDMGVVDTFTLTYPDEAWDNETLLVDPWTGDLVLVNKRAEFNHVYRLPAPGPGDLTAELEYVGSMIWGDQPPGDGTNRGIVGGDVSPTGREIILKNYHEVALFHRPLGTSLAEALVGVVPELLPYEEVPKGEGLSFDAAGSGYFTLGERENRPNAPLDYYPRDLSADIPFVAQFQQGVLPTPEYNAVEDALLRQSVAGTNFGSTPSLEAIADDGPEGDHVSAIMRWSDLSTVSPNSPIQTVSLTFDVSDPTSGGGYQLFEMRRDWIVDEVTFDQAMAGQSWALPGAGGAEDRGTTVLGTVRPTSTGLVSMTLNQDGVDVVQSWVLDPSTNHGFLLVGDDNDDLLTLRSSDYVIPRLRPKLLIGFLLPDDAPPTAGLISPVDNGPLDQDPADDRLLLNPTPRFEFQLTDREVDDASVTSATVVVTRNDAALIDGADYVFNYDAATDRIQLTSTLSKFDVGEYRITLSPAGQPIVDASGNEMVPREFVVTLDDSFPTPLEEVSPPGSLIYRRDTLGAIVAAGESQSFTIELDAGQTVAVVLSPEASLRPTVQVEGPAEEPIGVAVEAASAGQRTVFQAAAITDAGTYTVTVGETDGTLGGFGIELVLGAYVPDSAATIVLENATALGGGADRLAAVGQAGSQGYQFHLAAGQRATIALAGLPLSASVDLFKDGQKVAQGVPLGTNLSHSIEGIGGPIDANYTVSVGRADAEYVLLVTREAAFEVEPNNSLADGAVDITRTGVALGGFAPGESGSDDFYRFSVSAGDVLNITTSAPGDGAGEPVNALTRQLQLYAPNGSRLNSGSEISYSDTVDGQYSVGVRVTGGTTGSYVLRVIGHTGPPPEFAVSGSTFDEIAGTLMVSFNRPLSLDSLQPSDLQVNGQSPRRFDIVDGQRVIFTLPQLSILAGNMSMSIDAGAIEDLAGEPLAEFNINISQPLIPLRPLGSSGHVQGVGGQISAAGTTQQFLLELDALPFVSLLLAPGDATLRPTLQLISPVGEPQSFVATAAGEILLTPPIDVETAGAYTVVVGGADNTTGPFSLQAIVNGLLEDELLFNSSNDLIADAQDLDEGFIDLDSAGSGQRAVVFGTANPPSNATIVITETNTSDRSNNPDYVEIQNVSGRPVDTSGWFIVVNDAEGEDVNRAHGLEGNRGNVWFLPTSIAAGEILSIVDRNVNGTNYWGNNIYWRDNGDGWAMIVDGAGNIVDFIGWGYSSDELASLNVEDNNGFNLTLGDEWSGAGVDDGNPGSNSSYHRIGNSDNNTSDDWQLDGHTRGVQDPNLSIPFVAGVGFSSNPDSDFYQFSLEQDEVAALVLATSPTVTVPSYSNVVMEDGPVAFWRFADSSSGEGDRADDTTATHHGVYRGGLQFTDGIPGGSGPAGQFDGLNDHVAVMDPPGLQIEGQITLEAWVQVDSVNGFQNIISKGYTVGPAGEIVLRVRELQDGRVRYEVGSWTGGSNSAFAVALIPAEDVGTGKWTHLVGRYNGTRWELYRDGLLVGATGNTSQGAVPVNEGWAIGARGTGAERFFSGTIDEVAIYDKALTPNRIAAHYAAGTSSPAVSLAGDFPLALVDAAGEVLARSTTADGGFTHSIDGFVAPTTGPYFVHVSSTRVFPYSVVVTRGAAFNIEPNDNLSSAQDVSLVGGALGAIGPLEPLGDFYEISVQQGDTLAIATTTPADGPFQPDNNLDPAIELFDPSGNLVASDDNGAADSHNARLEHTATQGGSYRVRVFGADKTHGDYVLEIDGARGALAPLRVTSSDPPDGTQLLAAPTQITIDFSFPILRPDTLDPAVLTVGGVAATSVTALDGDTLRFDLPALAGETLDVVIAAGAIADVRGQTNSAYQAELTVDSVGPRVISSSIAEGDVLPTGSISLELTFDDRLNLLPLQSLGDVLTGAVGGQSYAVARVSVASELDTTTLTLEFDNLLEDLYTLRLTSGDGALEDPNGNDLDGEFVGGPGVFPTGDGQPGGDFVLNFSLDADALSLRPFERLQPLGSLAFASQANFGIVNTSVDRDDHTFLVEAGEVVTATVTPTDPAAILTVELVGEAGGVISAPGAGQPVVLPATIATSSGITTLRIGGDTAGVGYMLDVYRNVVTELADTSETVLLSIDASATGVGPQRLAALGTSFAPGSETLFATTGSQWKYLDDNSNQETAWKEFIFDDAGWDEEPSILGFGTLGGNGFPVLNVATTVNSGPQNGRFVTTYFRRDFDVPDPSIYESLSLQLLRDDGAAVYLNGEEIARSNLAGGAAFNTPALNPTNDDGEINYFAFVVDPGKLRAGRNVLAVEVHQVNASSSDLGMDAILVGTVAQNLQRSVDVDRYTLDLTGLAGSSIDVVLAGQERVVLDETVGVDYSGELLELLDVDGSTVLATATADPLGVPAENYDLAILGFTVPADGVYTLRLTSAVPTGQYGIVVTSGALFESEPNNGPADPRRTLETAAALGFLAALDADAFDVVLDAGQTLVVAARPLLGTAPGVLENTLDPRLVLLDGNQNARAFDDNSLDGRGALLDFRADEAGTYTILVQAVSGQGEYTLELLDTPVDFGDAPESYATLRADDGPRHLLGSGLLLGIGVTAETDGQPSPASDADVDDDGVTIDALKLGETAGITVVASAVGKLDAWIDFNGDGDWDDPGEQIFAGELLAEGSNTLPQITVPEDAQVGTTAARFRLSSLGGLSPRGLSPDGEVEDYSVTVEPSVPRIRVAARHIFYNNSRFDGFDPAINAADDLAIAPDKQPLLGDDPAGFASYTTFVSGINGIMVDVHALADAGDIDARHFVFVIGNTSQPEDWTTLAPPPSRVTVREGAGLDGSDRIIVTWPDGAIVNTWLRVTLLATVDTGLVEPDVFFVGNAVGDTGLGNLPDDVLVDEADRAATRSNLRNFSSPAPIDFPFDFNRDGLVDGLDRAIVRANLTDGGGGLILLNQPDGGPSPVAGVQFAVAAENPSVAADSPDEQRRTRSRRAARRHVFGRLVSHPSISRQRARGHGWLRSDAAQPEPDTTVGRRRRASAADRALEALAREAIHE